MPKVSIGLATYNGSRFLKIVIDSLLAQTFEDFELIISDNASTDGTERICREFAASDRRIRYYRSCKNLGSSWNHIHAFELATGEYFKWASDNDSYAPQYLERCVEALDQNPEVAVAHTKTIYLNEYGEINERYKDFDDLHLYLSPKPHLRFRDFLYSTCTHKTRLNAVLGLIRRDELAKTRLLENYILTDQILLGELTLRGKVFRVPEHLFFRRDFPNTVRDKAVSNRKYAIWFDPAHRRKIIILPIKWRPFFEHLISIRRVSLSIREQIWCYLYMLPWAYWHLVWDPLCVNSGRAYKLLTFTSVKQRRFLRQLVKNIGF